MAAIRRVAQSISNAVSETNPLVLAVMGCSTIFAGHLLPLLRFPLEYDYLHATRYGDSTAGGDLAWVVEPHTAVAGRTVLLVDDILDTGRTLKLIHDRIRRERPASLHTCVLLDKPTRRVADLRPDFVGFTIPDKFVVGYGLDFAERYRNLPCIAVLKPQIYRC